ncbi:hypothetical protein VPHK409_0030 [Vibrio phage K409]
MDTKALEEEFGFDPTADGGLDELHSSLHPEWPEHTGQGHTRLAVGEQVTLGATTKSRSDVKGLLFAERYGNSSKLHSC